MKALKETLLTIAVIYLISGIYETFTIGTKFEKYINYIVSLFVVLSLISPVVPLLKNVENADFDFFEQTENPKQNSNFASTFELSLNKHLAIYFNIPEESITTNIQIDQNNKEMIIDAITVYITSEDYFGYAKRIEAYLKANYGCDIKIIQDFTETR